MLLAVLTCKLFSENTFYKRSDHFSNGIEEITQHKLSKRQNRYFKNSLKKERKSFDIIFQKNTYKEITFFGDHSYQ